MKNIFAIATAFCAWTVPHTSEARQDSDAWVREVMAPQYFAVRVADVGAAVAWYRQAFELASIGGATAEDGSWQIENLWGQHLHVEIIRDNRAAPADRPLGLAKVGFQVPDVRLVADRVAASIGERPRVIDFEEHGMRILQLRDPEGNVIQLSSPLNRADGE